MLNSTKTAVAFIFLFIIPYIQSCKTSAVIATQSIQQADEYNNQKKFEEAILYYEKYIKMAAGLGVYRNLSMEAEVYRKLAHVYSTRLKSFLSRATRNATPHCRDVENGSEIRGIGSGNRQGARRFVFGPWAGLSDCSGGRAQAQGNLLHSRRRLCRGRNEARSHRVD